MKYLLSCFFLVCMFSLQAQKNYLPGYFVDNDGRKTSCYILDKDLNKNPVDFNYRLSDSSAVLTQTIETTKEFGINQAFVYKRFDVEMDMSNTHLMLLSDKKEAQYEPKTLFLRVLVEGAASLYMYDDGSLLRFFHKGENQSIVQLEYKEYVHIDGTEDDLNYPGNNFKVAENNKFQQQLYENLLCDDISLYDVKYISYNKRDLTKLYVKYNRCVDPEFVYDASAEKMTEFHFHIKPGINYSSLDIEHLSNREWDAQFEGEYNFRLGIESEIILPVHHQRWGILFEAAYQQFLSSTKIGFYDASIDYKSLEISTGVRNYLYSNKKSRLYINAGAIMDIDFDSRLSYGSSYPIPLRSGISFSVGLGYRYNNKIGVEFRYQNPRHITTRSGYLNSSYKTSSVVLGYTLN